MMNFHDTWCAILKKAPGQEWKDRKGFEEV